MLEHLLRGAPERRRGALRLVFVAAVYLFAVGYGMHEPADYLGARFCDGDSRDGAGALCAIVAYQDDELSHLLFFAGFAGIDEGSISSWWRSSRRSPSSSGDVMARAR